MISAQGYGNGSKPQEPLALKTKVVFTAGAPQDRGMLRETAASTTTQGRAWQLTRLGAKSSLLD